MAVSKVIYGNKTLIDLTGDTVTASTLVKGVTAHDAAGNQITGTAVIPTKTSELTNDSGFITDSVVAAGSTTSRTLPNRFADIINVKDYGAVGNGETDDTSSIRRALVAGTSSGKTVFFPAGTYLTTSQISLNPPSGRVSVVADKASIKLNSSSPVQSILFLSGVIEYDIAIKGLSFDANRKAFTGLFIRNLDNTTEVNKNDVLIENVTVENVYRPNDDIVYGDGIRVEGAFRNVYIIRPVVKNCVMASGAGMSGQRGIFGITVIYLLGSYDKHKSFTKAEIVSPYIENVYCEDSAYIDDQDAIRVFSYYQNTVLNTSSVSIRDVCVKNVRGRAVKGQVLDADINGVTIIHDADPAGFTGILTDKSYVDMQVGGGNVSNISLMCNGIICQSLVRMEVNASTPAVNTLGNISNVRCILEGIVPGSTVLRACLVGNSSASGGQKTINISGITVQADFNLHSIIHLVSSNRQLAINATGVSAPVSTAAIYAQAGTVSCNIVNAVNTSGSTVPAVLKAGSATVTGQSINLSGFSGVTYYNTSEIDSMIGDIETLLAAI